MFSKTRSLLLYAGLDKSNFDALTQKAMENNRKNLRSYSFLAMLVFAGLFVVSRFSGEVFGTNNILYGIMAVLSAAIYLCLRFFFEEKNFAILTASHVFVFSLYVFSVFMTLLHPEYPAVTSIVILFTVPYILYDRPIRLIIITVLATAALCVTSCIFKPENVAYMDIWNAVVFGIVAMVIETSHQSNKYRMLYQDREVAYLSMTDVLTGAKNRNNYEKRLADYPDSCSQGLVCVYTDANGLHEINHSKGHPAGDCLLKTTAKALMEHFGEDHTYRIGGDEFVCFAADIGADEIRGRMEKVEKELSEQEYSISWGISSADKEDLDMYRLTRQAEKEMFAAKARYYNESGHDRRR